MLILFLLLSPINRNVALLAILFNIVQTATLVTNQLTLIAAELLAANETALTDVAIRAYSYGEVLGLVFFGFTLLSVGYLIRHSGYLPWLLGVVLQIAGVSYVVNSFLVLVAPGVANIAFLIPSFVGRDVPCTVAARQRRRRLKVGTAGRQHRRDVETAVLACSDVIGRGKDADPAVSPVLM